MGSPHDLIADAARGIIATAKAADTGERWTLHHHYDALYLVDVKPSVPWETAEDDPTCVLARSAGMPDCFPYEDPADFAVVHEHADHIAGLDPAVGKAVGELLNEVADAVRIGVGAHEHDDERCPVPACRITTAAERLACIYLRPEGEQ